MAAGPVFLALEALDELLDPRRSEAEAVADVVSRYGECVKVVPLGRDRLQNRELDSATMAERLRRLEMVLDHQKAEERRLRTPNA